MKSKERETLYQLKTNREITKITSEYINRKNNLNNYAHKPNSIHEGAVVKLFLDIEIDRITKNCFVMFNVAKEILLNGKIDTENKKKQILSKIEPLRDPWIDSFEKKITSEPLLQNCHKNSLLSEFKRKVDSVINKIKTEVEIEFLSIKNERKENSLNKTQLIYPYDIALSYASEDSEYVDTIVKLLKETDINYYFAGEKEKEMWGNDLDIYLKNIFQEKSRFCIIFCSKHYKKKPFTNYERKCALNRSRIMTKTYILPVKLDNTKIPGIKKNIHFFDATKKSEIELIEWIKEKIGKKKINKKICTPKLIDFKIEPEVISKGGRALIYWKVENINAPLLILNKHKHGGGGIYDFGIQKEGKCEVKPLDSVIYTLIAKNSFGSIKKQIQLEVINS